MTRLVIRATQSFAPRESSQIVVPITPISQEEDKPLPELLDTFFAQLMLADGQRNNGNHAQPSDGWFETVNALARELESIREQDPCGFNKAVDQILGVHYQGGASSYSTDITRLLHKLAREALDIRLGERRLETLPVGEQCTNVSQLGNAA